MTHMFLKIMKGIAPVPGDSNSAEQGLDEVDLLDPQGFSTSEYDMKLPGLKSSAVYVDSPLSDGRTLISGTLGNVTETIRCELTAGTIVQLAAMLSKLLRFKQDCNDFWDTFGQIEPVYIKHQVVGEPGPRFALLYDIDIDIDDPITPGDPQRTVTIVIEREFGWRGLAPGDNPKRWAIEKVHNQQYTSSRSRLDVPQSIDTQFNLAYLATVYNRTEYPTSSKLDYTTKSFIDISGELIPGDLPALTCISFSHLNNSPPSNYITYVSRKSARADHVDPSIDVFLQSMMLNGCDMTLGANVTVAADTGAPLSQSLGARRRAVFTPVDNNDGLRLSVANRATLNHRGRYAVFCRCRQAAGAAGDISMYLAYGNQTPFSHRNVTTAVEPTLQAGTGNTTYWPVTYMGVIDNPIQTPAITSKQGTGAIYEDDDWFFYLYARRTAGTTAVLYVADFILIPIDEPTVSLISSSSSSTQNDGIVDSTGYFQHGKTEIYADTQGGTPAVNATEIRGQEINLLPGIDQRLYFFGMFGDNTSDLINSSFSVGVNIIPRWSGLRDV